MSIQKGQTIVYQDLVNAVLNLIETKCQNIGTGSVSSLPASLKKNTKYTVGTSSGKNPLPNAGSHTPAYTYYTAYLNLTNSNSPLVEVLPSTIENDFNTFLTSYGIARKANTIMTTKGILHFIACASVFIKTKVVVLTNDYDSNSAVVYLPTNTTYTTVTPYTSTITEDELTKSNLKEMVNGLNNNLGYFQCYYTMSMSCCSSCSSSCSSSSSSSSSSCVYIAYIDLGLWH